MITTLYPPFTRRLVLLVCAVAITCGIGTGNAQNQPPKFSLHLENRTVEYALAQIERQTPYRFVYSSNQLDKNRQLTLHIKDKTVLEALNVLFDTTQVDIRTVENQIVITHSRRKVEYGTVTGKVTDAISGEPLPGASVILKGTTKGVATSLSGNYVLQQLPAGTQTIVFNYIGYTMKEVAVEVMAGQSVTVNVSLGTDLRVLGEVVVSGSLEGQQKALNQQRTADNIKNIISADLIGRFPDLNVAEALQRVPGVNIERDRGEGGVIQMRGAPPGFTTVNINGEQIPGTQSGGERNQELSVLPADQLSSMEVVKAITPDQDGDNIGGTIDLKTPTAKGLKPKGKIELGGGYNNVVQRTNFIGRVGFNQRFFASNKVTEGRLGISVGGSYFETVNGRDRTQYNYNTVFTPVRTPDGQIRNEVLPTFYRLRDLENTRTRTGVAATADYKFSPTSQITFNYMYSQRFDRDREKRTQFDLGAATPTNLLWNVDQQGTYFNTNTVVRRFINPRIFDVKTNTFTLTGNHNISRLTVDYTLFVSDASNRNDAGRGYDFRSGTFTGNLKDYQTDFTNVVARTEGVDVHNPFLINDFRSFVDRADIITARNVAGKVNFTLPYNLAGKNASLKFGAKLRRITNDRDREFAEYDFVNDGSVNEAALFASAISDREDQQFLRGRVRFGPTLNVDRVDGFINNTFANRPGLFVFDELNQRLQRPAWFYQAQEDVFAAYAMTRVQLNKLMVLGGLRYERTSLNNLTASLITASDGSISIRDSSTRRLYDFVLPNLHLKYSINDLTNIRAAFTTSFARPNFTDVMPRENLNLANQSISRGNAALNPPRAFNFDLLFERYLKNVGIISGGVFYKNIQNFIFTRSFTEEVNVRVPLPNGGFKDSLQVFSVDQPQNGESADLYGAEINIQTNLDIIPGIPGFLKGVGIYANYTFTASRANTFERKNIRLPGQATHTANFALSYDYKKFTARAMFNFNGGVIRALGPDIAVVNGTNQTLPSGSLFDTFRADRYQLDVSASYNIGKGFRIYTEFINLTNRPEVEFVGTRNKPSNIEYFDWWNRFGMSFSF